MKVFRILTIACVAIAVTAMSVGRADAGFSFQRGPNIGKFVDRHTLWTTFADGTTTPANRLDTKMLWMSSLSALDTNGDGVYDMMTDTPVVELGLMLNVTTLSTPAGEYFTDADPGEMTGVLWGLKLNTFTITGAMGSEVANMTFVAGAFGANFAIFFDDAEDFAKTTDPVLSRAANGAGVPWSSSGAIEDAPALLSGIVDDAAGTGILIEIKNIDLNPGVFGISATTKAFLDVTGGVHAALIKPDGADITGIVPGTTQDIFVQTTFAFSSFDNPNFPEYDFTGVTGTSDDPFRMTVIPEPSSFALFGIGAPFLIGMALRRRKKNKATA